MSHEITSTDGIAYRLSEGDPWHGLGVGLPDDATLEDYAEGAGLRWRIKTAPVFATLDDGTHVDVPRKVMYRSDTKQVLDVIGPEYVPAQPDEVLEFFRDYLASGDMTMTTVGSLKAGRYVWAQANLRKGFTLAGGDTVDGRLLIANPNQYGRGLIVKLVMTRVVCANTIRFALTENGRQIVLAHNRTFDKEARDDAARRFGLAADAFENLKHEAEAFAATRIADEADVTRVLAATWKVPLTEDGEVLMRKSRQVKRCRELYDGAGIGASLPSAAGTAWGLLNAVTQYVDHEMGRGQEADRAAASMFGDGDKIKGRARKALWQLVK